MGKFVRKEEASSRLDVGLQPCGGGGLTSGHWNSIPQDSIQPMSLEGLGSAVCAHPAPNL